MNHSFRFQSRFPRAVFVLCLLMPLVVSLPVAAVPTSSALGLVTAVDAIGMTVADSVEESLHC